MTGARPGWGLPGWATTTRRLPVISYWSTRSAGQETRDRVGPFSNCIGNAAAVVAGGVHLGEGTQVMAGAVVQPGVRIGDNCIVNTRAAVDHDCLIGDHCHLAPGSVLSGGVTVGEASHIGTGAAVIQGICLGRKCLIGAGAAVTNSFPDGSIALGVPARLVRNVS
jgi:sugar O-acyltransferase (sialic acid O-acetyltransferase NeuD family)